MKFCCVPTLLFTFSLCSKFPKHGCRYWNCKKDNSFRKKMRSWSFTWTIGILSPRKERRCLSLKAIIRRNTKLLGKWLGETVYPLQPESWVQVRETTSLLTEVRLCTSKSLGPAMTEASYTRLPILYKKYLGNELDFGLTLGWVGFKKSKHPSASSPLLDLRKCSSLILCR